VSRNEKEHIMHVEERWSEDVIRKAEFLIEDPGRQITQDP
jgi:hypothetical protein